VGSEEMRRLILNVNAAALLAGVEHPSQKQVNRAVQTARDIDKAVRKRLRWEARRAAGGDADEEDDPR